MTDEDAIPEQTGQAFLNAEVDSAWGFKAAAVGLGIVGLAIAAVATIVALAGDDDDAAIRIVTTAPPATDVATERPESTIAGPPTTRNISITDEPIVIDADGNIVEPVGVEPSNDSVSGGDSGGDSGSNAEEGDAGEDTEEGAEEDDGRNLLGGDDPEDKLMPDVICMGLQAAQDEIQDHGVFGSKSKDASGDGRRQLWDRNWIVVGQEPEPGDKIGEFDAVLYVVKKNEDHKC